MHGTSTCVYYTMYAIGAGISTGTGMGLTSAVTRCHVLLLTEGLAPRFITIGHTHSPGI